MAPPLRESTAPAWRSERVLPLACAALLPDNAPPMLKSASLFLALRHLRPRRSFVSVITIISVLGVAVGVLMMIVVRAVMLGFEVDFRDTLMGSEPHVLISRAGSGPAWQDALAGVRARPETVSAAPYAGGMLYMAAGDYQTGGPALALPPAQALPVLEKLRRHLLAGSLDLKEGTIVLSDHHAGQLGVDVGGEISVYAGQNVNEAVRQYSRANEEDAAENKKAILDAIRLRPRKLAVAGILRAETGGYTAWLGLETGKDIFQPAGGVTGIAIELANPERAVEFQAAAAPELPGWGFTLWTDAGEARLAAMRNEQTMMQFVLSIIALVAAFSVMNTTITVTTQKRKEIGVLAALGAPRGQVVRVFVLQAAIVGVLGTGFGVTGALLVLWLREDIRALLAALTGGQIHAVEGVFLSSIPAFIQPVDVALTCLISLVLCLLAGLIPAWAAARVEPAEALRD